MYTVAAAFTAKIKTLQDYHMRAMHGSLPQPSGFDLVNNMTSLVQTLQGVLKEVPGSLLEMIKNIDKDGERLALLPTMDYKGLFNALVSLIEIVPLFPVGLEEFSEALFATLVILIPFLDRECLCALPYVVSTTLCVFPSEMHKDIMSYMIYYILPFAIARSSSESYFIATAIPAILMTALQTYPDTSQNFNLTAHHCHLLECLMALKPNLSKDMLCVIAYGPVQSRAAASKLLFYFWPTFNSTLFERKTAPTEIGETSPFACRCKNCPNPGYANAVKICYDVNISILYSSGISTPLYLCVECANEIHREHPDQLFYDNLLPLHQNSLVCESKSCKSADKSVVSICFSLECASFNGNKPIHYCQRCHGSRHNDHRGGDHVFQERLRNAWELEPVMRSYLMDAAMSLLKEARTKSEIPIDISDIQTKAASFNVESETSTVSSDERQLMGRFGALLLVGLCTPKSDTPHNIVGRMLSVVFNWFCVTAYSYDDHEEFTLEDLKKYNISKWLFDIQKSHPDVFVSCLLPHPPEYARIGGHWEMLVSRTSNLKNGLNRIYCLTPYNLITLEVWDAVMPHWMEAIVQDVPDKELPELKMIVSKMLDFNQCSIAGFDTKKMYHFISIRFKGTSAKVQEQALSWLQILTLLDIPLPIHMLFSFFEQGVKKLTEINGEQATSALSPIYEAFEQFPFGLSDDEGKMAKPNARPDCYDEIELRLRCCVNMLDIIMKQLELHRYERNAGIHSVLGQDIARLLRKTLAASWFSHHECPVKTDCPLCEARVLWHQLALKLVEYICPEFLAYPPDPPIEDVYGEEARQSPPDMDKKENGDSLNSPFTEINTFQIMTATVEAVVEQLDLAPIILTERSIPTIARIINPEGENAIGSSKKTGQSIASDTETIDCCDDSSMHCEDCWHTSVGKFRFKLRDLPPQLQYFHELFKQLPQTEDANILYFMLQTLYLYILHGDIMTRSIKDHGGFIIWCQENLVVKNMWELCNAKHSNLCEVCVPILLHCVTLTSGSDVFWKILQEEFHSADWRIRFDAVEKITVIARFMDGTPLRNNHSLQAVLTNAFCYLISSMDDPNELIAQRATLYMGTIHDYAMKSLIMCLESQFDSVIVDRPMVLQSLYQLHNCLSDRKILKWEFFLNRFDALFIEAQIHLERTGDVPHFRDLRNLDHTNEAFLKKLQRAQEALSQTSDTSYIKTLSASFGAKWPYKRTMSAPASILCKQDSKSDKDKVYSRQYSAPILKRKSSKFGLESYNPALTGSDEGHSIYATLHKIVSLEETDKETTHLLVFLFMQFLSRSDQALPYEEKNVGKIQNIVLRHLYLLLGYNQNERKFYTPAQTLRCSAVFNAFLSNLPQLLDQNHKLGAMIVPTALLVLQYCPSPPHVNVVDCPPNPTYTLWHLEPHVRKNWLMSLFVFLYKYNYKKVPLCHQVISLLKIVLNTLNAQNHICRRLPTTVIMSVPIQSSSYCRSRDVSQRSVGAETPPPSPGNLGQPSFRCKKSATSMETHWEEDIHDRQTHSGSHSMSGSAPDYKSDTTSPNSRQDSFEDAASNEPGRDYKKPTWYIGSEDYQDAKASLDSRELQDNSEGTPKCLSRQRGQDSSRSVESTSSSSKSSKAICTSSCASSESPLSRMEINGGERDLSLRDVKQLSLPTPERLLPIGGGLTMTKPDKLNLSRRPKSETDSVKSPRRLMKQVALESPEEDGGSGLKMSKEDFGKGKNWKGQIPCNLKALLEFMKGDGFWRDFRTEERAELEQLFHAARGLKQSSYRVGDECVYDRCGECGTVGEEYSDEELGLCIIVFGTFIHREPSLAAPILYQILSVVTKVSSLPIYSWQAESNVNLPGASVRVARQFLKVVLQHLVPNGVFVQIFKSPVREGAGTQFFKSVAHALSDFKELCPITPLIMLLEILNSKKTLPLDKLPVVLRNMATYVDCILTENVSVIWGPFLAQCDVFFRRITLSMPSFETFPPFSRNIINILRVPGVSLYKGILDPFSKILSYALQNYVVGPKTLLDICYNCNRAFLRDREKYVMTRIVIYELAQALKSKSVLPEPNLIAILTFLLQDLGVNFPGDELEGDLCGLFLSTGAADIMRGNFIEAVDFLGDFYVLAKIKLSYKVHSLQEDTFGGLLKAGIAQYVSLELNRYAQRDSRSLSRYFPWYANQTISQHVTRDGNECVNGVRLLSWLLIGTLLNNCANAPSICISIPQEASCFVAEYVKVVLMSLPEGSPTSVANVSATFHCFALCQLWTIYLEQNMCCHKPNTEPYILTTSILMDFWSKVTPVILQIMSHSILMAKMTNAHFIGVIEALLDCRSQSFNKLLPIWTPIINAPCVQLPIHLQARLHSCQNYPPSFSLMDTNTRIDHPTLLKWIRGLQFKMGQIEMQASIPAQFYPV